MVEAPSRFARFNEMRVHYKSYGAGDEALVFVHGWTCNIDSWRFQPYAFKEKIRVILIDLPGHGQSDKPKLNYTPDLFARSINAVLRHAGVKRATLVGHSLGAAIVRQFYRNYRDKTKALVMVDGTLRHVISKEDTEKALAPLRAANYQEAAEKFFGRMATQVPAEFRDQFKAVMLNTPQHVTLSTIDAMNDPELWKLDKINVPLLVIIAKTPFWPPDNEQFFRSLAPDLDYQVWEGVGHFLMLNKPARFNDAVSAFLIRNGIIKQ